MRKTWYYTEHANYTLGYILTTIPPEELVKRAEDVQTLEKKIKGELSSVYTRESSGYDFYNRLEKAVWESLKERVSKQDLEILPELRSLNIYGEVWVFLDMDAEEKERGYYLQREFLSDLPENTLIFDSYCA